MSHWIDPPAADLGQVAYDARMTDATPWENLSERERDGWRTLANAVAQAAEARRAAMVPAGPGRSAIAFVIDAHRFGHLSESEAMSLTRLDRLDVRGLVREHALEGYADPGAERMIRAVSVWGAMAAAIVKHGHCTWQDNGEPSLMAP